MKYNINTDTLLFLMLFTKRQHEKNIEKTLFVSAGTQKSKKQWFLEVLYHNIYRILKVNFP